MSAKGSAARKREGIGCASGTNILSNWFSKENQPRNLIRNRNKSYLYEAPKEDSRYELKDFVKRVRKGKGGGFGQSSA